MKQLKTLSIELFIIFTLVQVSTCQFLDPYGIYINYTSGISSYFKAGICNCENIKINNTVNFNNIPEVIIGNYYTYKNDNILVKLNISSYDTVNVFTDHINNIKYSLDGIKWSNNYQGQAYICNTMGFVLMMINSTTSSSIRFSTIQTNNCSIMGNNDTIVNTQIKGTSILKYQATSFGFAVFVSSNTPGCDLNTYLYYTGPNNNKYNYSIGSSFAQKVSYLGTYNLTFYIEPINPTLQCSITIHFSNLIYSMMYSSPIFFYNNNQIIDYLILNQTYDLNWKGTIQLDGGTSINSGNIQVQNLNNSQVYSIFKEYTLDLIQNTSYFQPLLINYGDYFDTNLTLTSDFNFTQNLIINSSSVIINVPNVPINLTVNDAIIRVPQNTTINGIQFQGNNTIWGSSVIYVQTEANFSGTLNLMNETAGTERVVMIYNFSNGTFSNIHTGNPCVISNPTYSKNQLSVAFAIKGTPECQTNSNNEDDGVVYYIVIPIVIILVILSIIAVILIIKVPAIRKRVFPHRDRVHYMRNKSYPPVNNDKIQRRSIIKKTVSAGHRYQHDDAIMANGRYKLKRSKSDLEYSNIEKAPAKLEDVKVTS